MAMYSLPGTWKVNILTERYPVGCLPIFLHMSGYVMPPCVWEANSMNEKYLVGCQPVFCKCLGVRHMSINGLGGSFQNRGKLSHIPGHSVFV